MRKWTIYTIIVLLALVATAEIIGVRINGEHLFLHQALNYKNVLEKEKTPEVVLDDPGFDQLFSYKVKEDWNPTFEDFIIGTNLDYSLIYNEGAIEAALIEHNLAAEDPINASINVETKEINEETLGTKVDIDAFLKDLSGKTKIRLSDYYIKPEITTKDLENALEKYDKLRNWHATYLSNGHADGCYVPEGYVTIDETGEIHIDSPDFIDDFVDNELDNYIIESAVGAPKEFTTHDGRVITIEGGTFGDAIDYEAEKEELKNLFYQGKSVEYREPIYSHHDGFIEDTYVEVSIPEQHVWVYKDGELVMDSDCVTGCVSKKNSTPTGMWYIYSMAKNRTLRPQGATSGSFVNRWMPFTPDGCGLHDATWRYSFGGQIYKTNGSHGCVNLPKKFAYELYDYVWIDMPVVVYDN